MVSQDFVGNNCRLFAAGPISGAFDFEVNFGKCEFEEPGLALLRPRASLRWLLSGWYQRRSFLGDGVLFGVVGISASSTPLTAAVTLSLLLLLTISVTLIHLFD